MAGWGGAGKAGLGSGHIWVTSAVWRWGHVDCACFSHLVRGVDHGIAHQGFNFGTIATEGESLAAPSNILNTSNSLRSFWCF